MTDDIDLRGGTIEARIGNLAHIIDGMLYRYEIPDGAPTTDEINAFSMAALALCEIKRTLEGEEARTVWRKRTDENKIRAQKFIDDIESERGNDAAKTRS